MNPILLGVLGYVVAQFVIGVLVSRGIQSEDDYLLGGRRFGYGLATFSFFATWFGAETCVGSAAAVYSRGLSGASADPFGYGACLLFMGLVFAAPLWRRKLTTLADLFRTRYSAGVERLAVLLMVPTSVLWAGAQIRAFGHVLNASSGIGVGTGITLAAGVAILYTGFGGMRADVITDLIQGLMIILGLIVVFLVLFPGVGELKTAWAGLEPGRLSLVGPARSPWEVMESWAVPVCGSVVAQELVARALACRSPQVARGSALAGGVLYLGVGLIPLFLGLVGANLFPNLQDPEQILSVIAREHLSPFFYVLFAGALVSAILSTVDSALLAASALVSHNLILPLTSGWKEAAKVRLSRAGVLVFGVAAYWLALTGQSVFHLVESASSFGSAGVFVVLVFGLFSRYGGARSAGGALLCGLATWGAGTWVFDWACPFLTSLVAAFLAYLGLGWFERPRRA